MAGRPVWGETTVVSKRTLTPLLLLVTLAALADSTDSSAGPGGTLRHLLKGTYVLYTNGVYMLPQYTLSTLAWYISLAHKCLQIKKTM